jgi:hypothetical protein
MEGNGKKRKRGVERPCGNMAANTKKQPQLSWNDFFFFNKAM